MLESIRIKERIVCADPHISNVINKLMPLLHHFSATITAVVRPSAHGPHLPLHTPGALALLKLLVLRLLFPRDFLFDRLRFCHILDFIFSMN